ncbi:MAG: 3-deoxy-D-manno-octulosonic acid transferase [Bacteroidales bacterium]|nr:3-deoxy-D-manno-octulosonic acid transferase [Bacteroidales bacterium]
MTLIYYILVHLAYIMAMPLALFSKKTRLWFTGRFRWRRKIDQWQRASGQVFWFHAASLGEFEQGLPVMESMKTRVPGSQLVLTFYSPSGYEVRKNFEKADLVTYLPLDTAYNAKKFIARIKPDAAFFIKYEFWYGYLKQLNEMHIPCFLISGIFRPEQVFFRWYGFWFRRIPDLFSHLFVQDKASESLLNSSGISRVTVSGDTRFDRVTALAAKRQPVAIAGDFSASAFCLIAGSTWPADEDMLVEYINKDSHGMKFIMAPHEIGRNHISRLTAQLKNRHILFSEYHKERATDKQVLIIDNVGMLSSLYRYGHCAYVGGGFGKGIHNILEAAVFGIPVIFGPNYHKAREAVEMTEAGAAFCVKSPAELSGIINKLAADSKFLELASRKARLYVQQNTGAAETIVNHVVHLVKSK